MRNRWINYLLILCLLMMTVGCKSSDTDDEDLVEDTIVDEINTDDDSKKQLITDFSQYSEEAMARLYMDSLASKQYEQAYSIPHDVAMTDAVNPEYYGYMMDALIEELGEITDEIGSDVSTQGLYTIYAYHYNFEGEIPFTFNVVFLEGEIAGLNYKPYVDLSGDTFYDEANYTEIDITFGQSPYEITGTLTVPKGAEKYPLVIMASGSGPNDRDETIGPNKPFKDISHVLGNSGIASIRFDKRTLLYGMEMSTDITFTIDQEYTEDIGYAIDYVTGHLDEINSIYVLGHSLGGHMVPRFAHKFPTVDGFIMLAAPANGLETLVPMQYEYIFGLDGTITASEQATIDETIAAFDSLNDMENIAEDQVIFGSFKAYWEDLISYDTLGDAMSMDQSLLIIQGSRDYQVPVSEFVIWQEALIDKTNVELLLIDGLNHLMMFGEGDSTPSEYDTPNHVDERVTDAIINFIP